MKEMTPVNLAELGPIETLYVADPTPPPHNLFDFRTSLAPVQAPETPVSPRMATLRNDYFQPGGP